MVHTVSEAPHEDQVLLQVERHDGVEAREQLPLPCLVFRVAFTEALSVEEVMQLAAYAAVVRKGS